MPPDYVDMAAIAEILGVDVATVRSLRSKGYLPEHDVLIGRSPGWKRSKIEKWAASRPGKAHRRKGQR